MDDVKEYSYCTKCSAIYVRTFSINFTGTKFLKEGYAINGNYTCSCTEVKLLNKEESELVELLHEK